MQVPVIDRWLAGDRVNETRFNAIAAFFRFLADRPGVLLRQTQAQPMTPEHMHRIRWDAIDFDNDNMRSEGQPTRVYIRTPGWWAIAWGVSLANAPANTEFSTGILVNGQSENENYTEGWFTGRTRINTGNFLKPRQTELYMNAGDYLEVRFQHWASETLSTIVSNAALMPFILARWVGR